MIVVGAVLSMIVVGAVLSMIVVGAVLCISVGGAVAGICLPRPRPREFLITFGALTGLLLVHGCAIAAVVWVAQRCPI
jgi:hypothetical protein